MQILDKLLFTSYHSASFCTISFEKLNLLHDLDGLKLQVRKNLTISCPVGIENAHIRVKHTKVSRDFAGFMLTISIFSSAFHLYNLRWVQGTPFASSEPYFSTESSCGFAHIKNDE
jgi:hypothetical protein